MMIMFECWDNGIGISEILSKKVSGPVYEMEMEVKNTDGPVVIGAAKNPQKCRSSCTSQVSSHVIKKSLGRFLNSVN